MLLNIGNKNKTPSKEKKWQQDLDSNNFLHERKLVKSTWLVSWLQQRLKEKKTGKDFLKLRTFNISSNSFDFGKKSGYTYKMFCELQNYIKIKIVTIGPVMQLELLVYGPK